MAKPQPSNEPRLTISTTVDADKTFAHLNEVMDTLLKLVEEETSLVRAGQFSEVARLEPLKAELARMYFADVSRLKASLPFLRQHLPKLLAALRERHHTFQALLQINLTVLATAHAVAEGIVRGVSAELTSKAAPQVYGASGLKSRPTARHALPLAVSRSL